MLDMSFTAAALAGLLSFFSPCILPMVPFYLCYMAGISMSELQGGDRAQERPKGLQRRLLRSAMAFAFGVCTIFVLLGMGATAFGQLFAHWQDMLRYVAAGVLLLFGLHFTGLWRQPLFYREMRLQSPVAAGNLFGAYLMGLAFGFGWTPCVGPALAAILMIAGSMGDPWRGGALLLVYGMAMTAPFVLAAMFSRPFLRWVGHHRDKLQYAEGIMGGMLILFALLIATNGVRHVADWLLSVLPFFAWVG